MEETKSWPPDRTDPNCSPHRSLEEAYKRLAFLAALGSNRAFALVTLIRKRCFAPTTFAVPHSPQLTPQLAACLAFR